MDALQGIPQNKINEHKKSPESCWRCGQSNHNTYQCYACTTAKGTTIPEAPMQSVAATTTAKRKGEENLEAPQPKRSSVAAAYDNDNRSEAPPAWAQDSDSEEDF